MKLIDQEKLDRLRQPLTEAGIDVDRLPQPETPEWDALVRQLSEDGHLALAQEFYTLAYDPEEQASAELIAAQTKRANTRGGLLSKVKPLTQTQTVNGDTVPNNKLVRNAAIAVGIALLAGVYFFQPPKPVAAKTTQATKTPTGSTGDTSNIPAAPPATKTTTAGGSSLDQLASNGKSGTTTTPPDTNLNVPASSTGTTPSTPTTNLYVPPQTSTASNVPAYDTGSTSLYVPPATTTPRSFSANSGSTQTTTPNGQTVTLTPAGDNDPALRVTPPSLIQGSTAQAGTSTASGAPAQRRAPPALVQGTGTATAFKPGLNQGNTQTTAGSTSTAAPTSTRPALVQLAGGTTSNSTGSSTSTTPSTTSAGTTPPRTGLVITTSTAPTSGGQGTQTPATTYGLVMASTTTSQNGTARQDSRTYGFQTTTSTGQGTIGAPQTAPTDTRYGLIQSAPAQPASTGAAQNATTPATAPAAAHAPYTMGQQLQAKLTTGTGVVDGVQSQVPVYAQAEDGSLWRGLPNLDGRKRLQITFDAVVKDGQEFALSGNAYSPNDHLPALPVKISATAPNAAYDLFNGLARASQAFAQAMLNQKTVSYQQGAAGTGVTTTNAVTPNFWLTAAAGVVGAFAVPESKNSVVMVAQLPMGTPVTIVVGGAGKASNGQ